MTHDSTPYTIDFALAGSYDTHGLRSVCMLLTMCMQQNSEAFLCRLYNSSIKDIDLGAKDTDLIFYFDGSKVCLFFFRRNLDQILSIFNRDGADFQASNLIGVVDWACNLVYFLPELAFVTPKIALVTVSKYFGDEKLPLTDVSQEGDAVMVVYNEMVASGLLDDIL